jgi:hypothetical protein
MTSPLYFGIPGGPTIETVTICNKNEIKQSPVSAAKMTRYIGEWICEVLEGCQPETIRRKAPNPSVVKIIVGYNP